MKTSKKQVIFQLLFGIFIFFNVANAQEELNPIS